MNTKTTLPITEARRRIFEIADKVQSPMSYYTLTQRGRPKVVIISAEEFESWQETLEVERMFPKLKKDIERVRGKIKSGKYKEFSTLEEILNKTKNKNGVSNKNRSKSRKRTS